MLRQSLFKSIVASTILLSSTVQAIALPASNAWCHSYAVTKEDFRNLPADASICNELGLKCLPLDASDGKTILLDKPIRYAEFNGDYGLNFKIPAQKGCFGPSIAYVEVPSEPKFDHRSLTIKQSARVSSLLPLLYNTVEWDNKRSFGWTTFEDLNDPNFTADGVCLTVKAVDTEPALSCAIYHFEKGGRSFEASVVGIAPTHCLFDGGENLYPPKNFMRRAGSDITNILAHSHFGTGELSSIEFSDFGVRIESGSYDALLEVSFRNIQKFEIKTTTVVETCSTFEQLNHPVVIRGDAITQAAYEKDVQRIVQKLATAMCKIYRSGKPISDEQSKVTSFAVKGDVRHFITCSGDQKSSEQ